MTTATVLARLRYTLRCLGWSGIVGIALAAFALTLQLGATRERETGLDATQAAIAALRKRAASAPTPVETPEMQLARFHQSFPPDGALADLLTTLNQAAAAHGLSIRNAEYREQLDAASGLKRYSVTLPFKGGYMQIRAWLADVLNAHPTAVLDELQMKRENIGAGEIEARLRLSLYVEAR